MVLADVSKDVIAPSDAQRILSRSETDRAAKCRTPARRHRYVQCHALLRRLLAERTGLDAADMVFSKGEFGKPLLAGEAAGSGITFNISHSGSFAVVAIGRDVDIGVDIEMIKPGRDFLGIVDHFFSSSESCAIRALPHAEQEAAFYTCWCRKESFIKATGCGLQMPLNGFAVSVEPQARAKLLWVDGQTHHCKDWQMHTLPTPPGYVGALTLSANRMRSQLHTMQNEVYGC